MYICSLNICNMVKKEEMTTNDLDSMCGISDDELTFRFREAVRLSNEKKRIMKRPIAGFDEKLNKPYIEYPDGSREYR